MRKITNKKGFTLIELIVVIAILGILAAVAVPRFAGFQESAKVKSDIANARILASATNMAIAEGAIVPGTTDASDIQPILLGTKAGANSKTYKYIESWPVLKATGATAPFVVTVSGSADVSTVKVVDSTATALEIFPTPATDGIYDK